MPEAIFAFDLNYSGQIVDDTGAPPRGPVDLTVRFFGSANGAVSTQSTVASAVSGSTVTFTLDRAATVIASYSMNIQPNRNPGGDYIATTLCISWTCYSQAGSHFQPYCSGDCNIQLSGTAVANLAAGSYTADIYWRCASCAVSWSSDPGWTTGGGFRSIGGRTLTIMAFYQ